MNDILHHHDHASVLLDGDLDWPRSGVDGRFERRRFAPWTEMGPENASQGGPPQSGDFVTLGIRARPGGST